MIGIPPSQVPDQPIPVEELIDHYIDCRRVTPYMERTNSVTTQPGRSSLGIPPIVETATEELPYTLVPLLASRLMSHVTATVGRVSA